MNFCSHCGQPVAHRIPEGDSRLRYVCDNCKTVHYQNPKVVCGCLPVWQDSVLLCRRAIEPRRGFWTLPAGFMENGETTPEAAARETREEAAAEVAIGEPYALFNIRHINQVYLMFRATLTDGVFGVGEESLECRLFTEDEIPWDELAFPTIARTLKYYFEDRKGGTFPFRMRDIELDFRRSETVKP
ncbi:MAG: ADP-ribose pyrophosphatase [Moraxellaceae bacterium]|jgi:ADP-ribose pyrophosphatase YjhB (NUDIX family)|nr:ADP-ribose pyrophosphatase [Moraxellaceae bacterium]MDF3032139.1 ADP-ribose pyrophosphatase [Moraxellaceae bacterium]